MANFADRIPSPVSVVPVSGPSRIMEYGCPPKVNTFEADYPESAWTANAREQLFTNDRYAYSQTMWYGSQAVQVVTWDYASNFLYAHPELTPYPYVLVPQG